MPVSERLRHHSEADISQMARPCSVVTERDGQDLRSDLPVWGLMDTGPVVRYSRTVGRDHPQDGVPCRMDHTEWADPAWDTVR